MLGICIRQIGYLLSFLSKFNYLPRNFNFYFFHFKAQALIFEPFPLDSLHGF